MGLMTGFGPLSSRPAGTWNFEPPPPGRALYLEPSPKRVRVLLGGETIADSQNVMLLSESGAQPVYYFPPKDVRADVLVPSDHTTHCPKKGDAAYYSLRVGETVLDAGAWYYPELLPGAPSGLRGLIAFFFERMERWLEEDEEIVGHPRDPYHRVDVIPTSRHVRVLYEGEVLADSRSAMALFESNLPTRWYLPRSDVAAALEPSARTSLCPYKGTASYWSVRLADGRVIEDLIWFYTDPLPAVERVQDRLCFYNERVDIELDGEPVPRSPSP